MCFSLVCWIWSDLRSKDKHKSYSLGAVLILLRSGPRRNVGLKTLPREDYRLRSVAIDRYLSSVKKRAFSAISSKTATSTQNATKPRVKTLRGF